MATSILDYPFLVHGRCQWRRHHRRRILGYPSTKYPDHSCRLPRSLSRTCDNPICSPAKLDPAIGNRLTREFKEPLDENAGKPYPWQWQPAHQGCRDGLV